MRNFPLGLALAALIAAGICGCDRAEPGAAPPGAPPQQEVAAAEPTDPVVIPPFDPSLPPLELAVPPTPRPQIAGRPPNLPRRHAAAPPAAVAPTHPTLDALLRAPYAPPTASSTVDLGPAASARIEPKPPRALDPLGPSIRLERRGESIGPAGPRQGTYWETDAGVRFPVDKSVSLEGGVRVDSRDEPGAKQTENRPTPRVGVQVKF